mmetsp:Transcript_102942/g.332132  ORF Transcript_102942/g.332132 Transcript_102942/m.332132 type:complete len:310 (+) Transcript_102942:40-969(+)
MPRSTRFTSGRSLAHQLQLGAVAGGRASGPAETAAATAAWGTLVIGARPVGAVATGGTGAPARNSNCRSRAISSSSRCTSEEGTSRSSSTASPSWVPPTTWAQEAASRRISCTVASSSGMRASSLICCITCAEASRQLLMLRTAMDSVRCRLMARMEALVLSKCSTAFRDCTMVFACRWASWVLPLSACALILRWSLASPAWSLFASRSRRFSSSLTWNCSSLALSLACATASRCSPAAAVPGAKTPCAALLATPCSLGGLVHAPLAASRGCAAAGAQGPLACPGHAPQGAAAGIGAASAMNVSAFLRS